MSTYTQSMFDSIKTALQESTNGSGTNVRADILKFKPGNQYDLRLLPNVKEPEKTFFHYYNQSWTSFCTGQYVSAMSPQTFGKSDIIATTKFKLKANGTEEEKRRADTIRRSEQWLVNVFVVDDPTTPENNGQVKIMRFGKQLNTIIMDCLQDTDDTAVGARAFDLTDSGCNFRVKVDKQGDFPSYVTSKFLLPSALPAIDQEAILDSVYELDKVFNLKTDDELLTMLDEHLFCNATSFTQADSSVAAQATAQAPTATTVTESHDTDLDEDVPMDFPEKKPQAAAPAEQDDDAKLNELLAGLDDA